MGTGSIMVNIRGFLLIKQCAFGCIGGMYAYCMIMFLCFLYHVYTIQCLYSSSGGPLVNNNMSYLLSSADSNNMSPTQV